VYERRWLFRMTGREGIVAITCRVPCRHAGHRAMARAQTRWSHRAQLQRPEAGWPPPRPRTKLVGASAPHQHDANMFRTHATDSAGPMPYFLPYTRDVESPTSEAFVPPWRGWRLASMYAASPPQSAARKAYEPQRRPPFPLLALAERFAFYATALRACISHATDVEDAGSAAVYTDISRGVEKQLWFLEVHLHQCGTRADSQSRDGRKTVTTLGFRTVAKSGSFSL
jgi:hypothetical protein